MTRAKRLLRILLQRRTLADAMNRAATLEQRAPLTRAATAVTALLLLLLAAPAPGAARARYGGVLKVTAVAPALEQDPLLADTPAEATLVSATASSLCRWDAQGQPVAVLAQELTRPTPQLLRLTLRPGLRLPGGAELTAREVAASLTRAQTSAYRALLAPLRLQDAKANGLTLELPLAFPFPDAERAACSPALAIAVPRANGAPLGLGPFSPGATPFSFDAQPLHPDGRPYADGLLIQAADERSARHQFTLKKAQVVLGAPPLPISRPAPEGPLLYATYLAFQPQRVGAPLRQALESAVDRADLTRFFARAPAVPMHGLLPPALMAQEAAPRPAPPRAPSPAPQLQLLFDAQSADQRAVAERLQVKLQDRGYRLALKGVPRAQLRSHLAARDFDLLLHAVLVPPVPSLALALALDAGGRAELLAPELSAIGALPDAAARDARAAERAAALAPTLPLIPLYAQGLSVQSAAPVLGLTRDGQGLPSLADAFLAAEGP